MSDAKADKAAVTKIHHQGGQECQRVNPCAQRAGATCRCNVLQLCIISCTIWCILASRHIGVCESAEAALTVGLILSMGSAADTALTKAGPPATPGKSFWIGAPACAYRSQLRSVCTRAATLRALARQGAALLHVSVIACGAPRRSPRRLPHSNPSILAIVVLRRQARAGECIRAMAQLSVATKGR